MYAHIYIYIYTYIYISCLFLYVRSCRSTRLHNDVQLLPPLKRDEPKWDWCARKTTGAFPNNKHVETPTKTRRFWALNSLKQHYSLTKCELSYLRMKRKGSLATKEPSTHRSSPRPPSEHRKGPIIEPIRIVIHQTSQRTLANVLQVCTTNKRTQTEQNKNKKDELPGCSPNKSPEAPSRTRNSWSAIVRSIECRASNLPKLLATCFICISAIEKSVELFS